MQLKSMLSKFFKQKIKTNDDTSKASNTSKCRGFSLIDSMISFLIITIIVAAFAPVVIKKMTHGRGIVLKEGADTTKSCPHDCILCKADGTCLLCPLRCDEGFYKDKQGCQCVDCTETGDENCTGCKRQEDAVTCTKCKTGYYLDEETHTCKECEAGYYCPNGITRVPCEKGTYNDGTFPVEERYECDPCPPGTYQDEEGQTTCKLCNGGYYCAAEGMDHRDSCEPGSFSRSEGAQTKCTDCYEDEPEGFGGNTYSGTAAATCPLCTTKPNVATCQKEGGAIITCQTGYYHSTSPDVCANCSAGYYMNASHKCQKCTEGSTPDNNTLTQCLSCGEHCADCDISTLQCRACDEGYTLDPSTHRCKTACAAGTYFDGSTCKDCPDGTYSSTSGATECTPCNNSNYCTACDKSSGECQACHFGYILNTSTKDCEFRCGDPNDWMFQPGVTVNRSNGEHYSKSAQCISRHPLDINPNYVWNQNTDGPNVQITTVYANQSCTPQPDVHHGCCWKSNVAEGIYTANSSTCTGNGCETMVCDYYAANKICKTHGGTLAAKEATMFTLLEDDLIKIFNGQIKAFTGQPAQTGYCAIANYTFKSVIPSVCDYNYTGCNGSHGNVCRPSSLHLYSPSSYSSGGTTYYKWKWLNLGLVYTEVISDGYSSHEYTREITQPTQNAIELNYKRCYNGGHNCEDVTFQANQYTSTQATYLHTPPYEEPARSFACQKYPTSCNTSGYACKYKKVTGEIVQCNGDDCLYNEDRFPEYGYNSANFVMPY